MEAMIDAIKKYIREEHDRDVPDDKIVQFLERNAIISTLGDLINQRIAEETAQDTGGNFAEEFGNSFVTDFKDIYERKSSEKELEKRVESPALANLLSRKLEIVKRVAELPDEIEVRYEDIGYRLRRVSVDGEDIFIETDTIDPSKLEKLKTHEEVFGCTPEEYSILFESPLRKYEQEREKEREIRHPSSSSSPVEGLFPYDPTVVRGRTLLEMARQRRMK